LKSTLNPICTFIDEGEQEEKSISSSQYQNVSNCKQERNTTPVGVGRVSVMAGSSGKEAAVRDKFKT